MKRSIYFLTITVISLLLSQAAFADVKIKSRQSMSGQSYENTTYIKGKRSRSETMNGMMINLTQCDLRRGIQMNPKAKTYVINEFATASQPGQSTATTDKNGVVQAGGKVTTTVTSKDTGERKQMFGFIARHLIVTMEMVSSPDACAKNNMKMVTDGWYIDAEFALDCDYGSQGFANHNNPRAGGCKDRYEMKTIGVAKRGYPVYEKMTMFDESGKETMSFVNEVVELSKATLEASLFDVPADYREVQDASQMYSASTSVSMSSSASTSSRYGSSVNIESGLSQSIRGAAQNTALSPTSASSAKQAGVVRIGLAAVKTGAVGDGLAAADLAAATQNTLMQFLKVPNVEVITLDARLASAIDAEAAQNECDFVLYANVSHKKGGGGGFGGMFGSALGSAVGRVGLGGFGNTAANVAGQVATQAIVTASAMSSNVKSKDEITLDVKLNKIGGAAAMANTYKAKAKSNGEDIISNVVEQAARTIVNSLGK